MKFSAKWYLGDSVCELIPKKIEKEFIYSLILDDHKKFKEVILENKLDYERILSILSHNRIEYFVLNKLDNVLNLNELPINFLDKLKKNYFKKSIPTLKIIEKVFLLSEKLLESNIEHVFLKGISLYDQNSIYMRPMRDIDILVNPEDILSIVDLAKSLNFKFKNKEVELSESYINNLLFYDLPLMVDNSGVFLEIHYRITIGNENCLLKDNLLESKRIIKIHDKDLCLPSFSSLFMHLVYHGSKKGNFNAGLSVLTDLLFLHGRVKKNEVLRISEPLELKKISELFFELIEFSKNKKLILNKNSETLKEILIFPALNPKFAEILTQESFQKMLGKLKNALFVPKSHLHREFEFNNNLPISFHLAKRWIRQINKYFFSILFVIKNLNLVIKRTKYIEDISKK